VENGKVTRLQMFYFDPGHIARFLEESETNQSPKT
jgi:hypothetical protein